MSNEEVWKDITDYEGLYQVSNFGNIKNLSTNTLVNQSNTDGYLIVNLKKGTKTRIFKVHRLVARAFLPDWSSELCVDHKDNNRSNNHVSNLQMITIKENNLKTIRDGNTTATIGKRRINQICPKTFKVINTYESFMAAARGVGKYTASAGNGIQKTCTGTRVGQKAYGYFWELA